MTDFVLTPPEFTDIRFKFFRMTVEAFYLWKWGRTCPWDGAESNQLTRLLKADPKLTLQDFRLFLYNYGCSDDITPGERPRSFIPRLHNYSVTSLDRFGRDPNASIQTSQTQRARRNDSAFEQARANRGLLENPVGDLPAKRVDTGRDRALGDGLEPLLGGGD